MTFFDDKEKLAQVNAQFQQASAKTAPDAELTAAVQTLNKNAFVDNIDVTLKAMKSTFENYRDKAFTAPILAVF